MVVIYRQSHAPRVGHESDVLLEDDNIIRRSLVREQSIRGGLKDQYGRRSVTALYKKV